MPVEAILTIQIGDHSSIFALYLHVDNINPKILSLLIESKGTQIFVMGTPVSESSIFFHIALKFEKQFSLEKGKIASPKHLKVDLLVRDKQHNYL